MKKILAMILASSMAFGLVACGSGTANPTPAPSDPGTGTSENTGGGGSSQETLMIYSNSAGEGRGEWLTQRASEAGYSIDVVSLPGGDLANRLIAEKNNPLADMVYGLNAMDFENLKKEDLLMAYEPSWAGEVDMTLGDDEGYYYPIVAQPIVLAMNSEMESYPSDWIDLAGDDFVGQYTVLNTAGGSSRAILTGILTRYQDPNGELGISDEGWEICKGYIQNGVMEILGDDFIGSVISGKVPMSGLWGSGVVQFQNERDYQFQIMSPEVGVPYITEQCAIITGTSKADLAEEFINWFGSAEIQGEWSAQFGTIPVHPDALSQAPADVLAFSELVPTPQQIDWGFAADNIAKWCEKIELEFVL